MEIKKSYSRAEIIKILQENENLKRRLNTANGKIKELWQKAKSWEKAADGLARMVEEMKEKQGAASSSDTNRNCTLKNE